jgi:hypothetical protein
MFKNIGFDAIVACATIASMVYYSMTVLWPTILQTVYTADVMQVGWQSSVVGGGVLLGQILSGFALSYVPRVKIQCIVAAALVLACFTALTTLSPDRLSVTIALGVLGCTAVGYLENITLPGVTLLWEPQDIGLATGVLGSIRGLGGAVAQALYMSVYTNKLGDYVPRYVTPAAIDAGLPASSLPGLFQGIAAGELASVPGMTDRILAAVGAAVVRANTDSFRIVLYITIPFSVVVLGAAALVPNVENYLTKDVARRLQEKEFRREDLCTREVTRSPTEA